MDRWEGFVGVVPELKAGNPADQNDVFPICSSLSALFRRRREHVTQEHVTLEHVTQEHVTCLHEQCFDQATLAFNGQC